MTHQNVSHDSRNSPKTSHTTHPTHQNVSHDTTHQTRISYIYILKRGDVRCSVYVTKNCYENLLRKWHIIDLFQTLPKNLLKYKNFGINYISRQSDLWVWQSTIFGISDLLTLFCTHNWSLFLVMYYSTILKVKEVYFGKCITKCNTES